MMCFWQKVKQQQQQQQQHKTKQKHIKCRVRARDWSRGLSHRIPTRYIYTAETTTHINWSQAI